MEDSMTKSLVHTIHGSDSQKKRTREIKIVQKSYINENLSGT